MSGRAGVRVRSCLALAIVAALTSCTPASDAPDPLLQENELVARQLLAAWEQGDVDGALRLFRPDAVYDDFPNSVQHQGVQEIGAYLAQIHEWGSDVVVNVTNVTPSPRGATAEWVLSAVQSGAIAGRVDIATGVEVVLNGVTLLDIQDGLIARAADYVDTLPLVLQTGGTVELPGGQVIDLQGAR